MDTLRRWLDRLWRTGQESERANVSPLEATPPRIVIRDRNTPREARQVLASTQVAESTNRQSAPVITIHRVNERPNPLATTVIYGSEVRVERTDLGRGITVNRRRKPTICPECRTPNSIIPNEAGRDQWRCTVCEKVFS
jgi:hypothetical protein